MSISHSNMFPKSVAAATATAGVIVASNHSTVQCQEEHKVKDMVAIYLSPDSQQNLKVFLNEHGLSDYSGKYVVVTRLTDKKGEFIYQPLFGERAAFRLKGIAKADETNLAITGRVSIMTGELSDDNFTASLPLIKDDDPKSKSNLIAAIDLLSRLKQADVVRGKPVWQGRIRPYLKVLDVDYPTASKASFKEYGKSVQIVIDGTLCSSRYIDADGKCNFDRSSIQPIADGADSGDPQNNSITEPTTSTSDTETATDNTKECPVCKYMRAGPCKDEFNSWDTCVADVKEDEDLSVCFSKTLQMMQCMKNHEYYDIMTANTSHKVASLAATVDNAKRTNEAELKKTD